MSNLIKLLHPKGEVFAVDLDGSTEYISNLSPVNLDLNGDNLILDLERNSTFEDNATDWVGAGNHVVTIDGTSKLTGTYSGVIVASGVGDPTTNFVSLPADKFTALEDGKKYILQIQVRAVLTDTDVTLVIGGKSKTFTAVDQTDEILVFNFEATSAEIGQKIIIYLSQADDVYVDEVDLNEAWDMTVIVWAESISNGLIQRMVSSFPFPNNGYLFAIRADNEQCMASIQFAGVTFARYYLITDSIGFHLYSFKIDRLNGELTLGIDGVWDGGSKDITNVGAVRLSSSLLVGSEGTYDYFNGYIGETQIIRGILSDAQILDAFRRGQRGKHFLSSYPGLTVLDHWKWAGNTNEKFLSSETGNNDLTSINVTQSDDQIKLKKYT